MKIYFDMNIYNRIFDDQTQMRIRFESLAIDILFELVEKGGYKLMWSFMLEYENYRNPDEERRLHIEAVSTLCEEIIKPNAEIAQTAKYVAENSNVKEYDALHLASAVYGGCNYFITCDDRFIRAVSNNKDKLNDIIKDISLANCKMKLN
ncbi:MAG: type II toxin-antitoxin system VapC family toxin [Anaerovoracaceae bacterium]|jgi:predicted nucleic acid-binding protein